MPFAHFHNLRQMPARARTRPTATFLALRAIRFGLPEAIAEAVAERRAALKRLPRS
jgi:hypothetical protein